MKILIVNTVPTEKNGITNVIFNYLKSNQESDITFDYVSINKPDNYYWGEIEDRGGMIYVLPRLSIGVISYWNRLRKLIKSKGYGAVHIHGNSHTVVLELAAVKAAGCAKGIVHAHSTFCTHVMVHKLLTPVFNTLCDYGLACGEKAGHFMFGKKKFTVINNGVDVVKYRFDASKRQEIRSQLDIKDNECLLGHVGYFQEVKNQKFIVETFLHLNSQYKLVLIGDGPQRHEVEQQVEEYGLSDRVIFTGNINNVDEYLCAIDLIVMPSLFEGVPLTLIEQQANGLHCVASDTITREADKTGYITFVPLSDGPIKWASLIKDMPVEMERTKKSENAIRNIETAGYSIQREANKLLDFYHSI